MGRKIKETCFQTMSRSYLLEENKRIMMDLEMVTRTGACPHIVRCYGYFITQVESFVYCFFYNYEIN